MSLSCLPWDHNVYFYGGTSCNPLKLSKVMPNGYSFYTIYHTIAIQVQTENIDNEDNLSGGTSH